LLRAIARFAGAGAPPSSWRDLTGLPLGTSCSRRACAGAVLSARAKCRARACRSRHGLMDSSR
jgi:hypothetical protein